MPEPAANKEEIEGEKAESAARFYLFLLGHAPHPHPHPQRALVEEDIMMDSVQTAAPAQPTEDLTELGKCLMKHEVSIT